MCRYKNIKVDMDMEIGHGHGHGYEDVQEHKP
jgi:hypothetical protein